MKAGNMSSRAGKDVDYRIVDRLRQLSFPDSVAAAVQYIDAFLYGQQTAIPNEAMARHLADQFIFLLSSYKSTKKPYTSLQELQLEDILLKQLQVQENPHIRTRFYLLLFGGSEHHAYKTDIQCRLVSLAVATESAKVLDATAEWMKDQRFCGRPCIELTQYVINDYCRLNQGATSSNLSKLPIVSPQFTCSLITALTHVYNSHRDRADILPPLSLLETIALWVSSDSCLLLATAAPALVSLANCTTTETAIPGLISWCILAPLLLGTNKDTETMTKLRNLYSRLHLGLLNVVLTTINMPHIQRELLPSSCIQELVEDVLEFVADKEEESECVQTSIERLAQLLQVAKATGSVNCTMLRKICAKLPKNKLMDLVLVDETMKA